MICLCGFGDGCVREGNGDTPLRREDDGGEKKGHGRG